MADASIINFKGIGELAKPIEKLIEKVSEGVGTLYEPTRIRRKAKAEADATEIEARTMIAMGRLLTLAKVENRELAERALVRFVQEECKAQENMEDVLRGATHYLTEDAKPEEMNNDWLRHFFGKCKMVSDKEMQDLWSRVLAGEANHPGSFSKRTIEFISTVSKGEAEVFTRLCRFAWSIQGAIIPVIRDYQSSLCKENGLTFEDLQAIDSIGLVQFDGLAGYHLDEAVATIVVTYGNNVYHLHAHQKGRFQVGHVVFSPLGLELFRLLEPEQLPGLVENTLKHWMKNGYAASSPWPRNEIA